MKGGGIRVFQLPVIVTAAETVVIGAAVHQDDDKNKEGEMLSIPPPSNPAPKATTIAAGDDDNQVRNSNSHDDNDTVNHTTACDDHPATTTTLDHDDSKLKRMPSFMLQSLKELLISLSCSLLLKFVFGGLWGIRTFCLVHFCNFCLSCQSTTEQVVTGQWIPTLWQHLNTAVVESSTMTLTTIEKGLSNHHFRISSWPPPTLLALGLFTIGTLIVHPDGYTWIVIHRIRDATYFAMQSSTTCWAIAVNDYGSIISSILAMSTFATLFFFAYVLHRTLKSRTVKNQHHQQSHKHSEKHKKKKRKHGHTRNGQKSADRIRSVNDIDQGQDQLLHNADSTNDGLISHSSDHHILPPLAEDEPLESPPPTESSFAETLAFISKYESPQSHLNISRSRTASSSTADSVACSLDDQSSCSGRSTPTPISVNESVHPHFVTALAKPSTSNANALGVRGNHGGQIRTLNATPTPPLSQTPRRNQNNRRSGKKSNSQLSEVPVAAVANQSPPLTPSKRWDALKPTNRSYTTRQQQQQQRQQFLNKSGRTETIKSRVVPRLILDHELQSTTDMAHECKTQNATLVAVDNNRELEPTDCSTPLMGIHLTGATDDTISLLDESLRDNQNEYSFGLVSDDRISCSELNPNSNTWTGTMNVVPKDQTYTSPLSTFHGYDDLFGLNVPRFQNVPLSWAEGPSPHHPTPHGGDPPSNQFYGYSSSERVETTGQSTPGGRPTPPFGLSLLHGIPGSTIDSVDHGHLTTTDPYAAAASLHGSPSLIDSTMRMTRATHECTTTSPTSATGQYYHHHHRSHAVVRENPFATSDDDDDDQMIEAKLLELGGQMVGSILDC